MSYLSYFVMSHHIMTKIESKRRNFSTNKVILKPVSTPVVQWKNSQLIIVL